LYHGSDESDDDMMESDSVVLIQRTRVAADTLAIAPHGSIQLFVA
jgi:hypothetical protein